MVCVNVWGGGGGGGGGLFVDFPSSSSFLFGGKESVGVLVYLFSSIGGGRGEGALFFSSVFPCFCFSVKVVGLPLFFLLLGVTSLVFLQLGVGLPLFFFSWVWVFPCFSSVGSSFVFSSIGCDFPCLFVFFYWE